MNAEEIAKNLAKDPNDLSISPFVIDLARALLVAIEALEQIRDSNNNNYAYGDAREALAKIRGDE